MFENKILKELSAEGNTVADWVGNLQMDIKSEQRVIDHIRDHYLHECGLIIDRGVVVHKNPITNHGDEYTVCNNPTAQRKMLDDMSTFMKDLIEVIKATGSKVPVVVLEDIVGWATDFDCERYNYIEKGAK